MTVKTRDVAYYSQGEKILGTMYLPDDYQEGQKLPCIIPCSGYTGLKVVYPALMARALTKRGYVCLGFDFRGWGPSEGAVGYTTFETEYEDILASYVFATQQPEVDAENIGIWAWAMSAPIAIRVGVDWPEIKAIAVANSLVNGKRRGMITLGVKDSLDRAERAKADRIKRVLTGKGEMIPTNVFNQPTDDHNNGWSDYRSGTISNLNGGLNDYLTEIYGAPENYPPKQSWAYYDSQLRVNAEEYVAKLAPRGLHIGHGNADPSAPYYEAECLYAAAGEGKEMYTVNGRHNDWMYDDHPEFIKYVDNLVKFFDKHLKNS